MEKGGWSRQHIHIHFSDAGIMQHVTMECKNYAIKQEMVVKGGERQSEYCDKDCRLRNDDVNGLVD
jgi:hypothetical protein